MLGFPGLHSLQCLQLIVATLGFVHSAFPSPSLLQAQRECPITETKPDFRLGTGMARDVLNLFSKRCWRSSIHSCNCLPWQGIILLKHDIGSKRIATQLHGGLNLLVSHPVSLVQLQQRRKKGLTIKDECSVDFALHIRRLVAGVHSQRVSTLETLV